VAEGRGLRDSTNSRFARRWRKATVDANGEDEQHSGLLSVIGDELAFPFPAKVLGEVVNVVGMAWPEDDEFGLNLVCERGAASD
jgi:hypothetical protein